MQHVNEPERRRTPTSWECQRWDAPTIPECRRWDAPTSPKRKRRDGGASATYSRVLGVTRSLALGARYPLARARGSLPARSRSGFAEARRAPSSSVRKRWDAPTSPKRKRRDGGASATYPRVLGVTLSLALGARYPLARARGSLPSRSRSGLVAHSLALGARYPLACARGSLSARSRSGFAEARRAPSSSVRKRWDAPTIPECRRWDAPTSPKRKRRDGGASATYSRVLGVTRSLALGTRHEPDARLGNWESNTEDGAWCA